MVSTNCLYNVGSQIPQAQLKQRSGTVGGVQSCKDEQDWFSTHTVVVLRMLMHGLKLRVNDDLNK